MASAGPYANLHQLQTDNHASTPRLSFLQAGCPSCRPTNSVKVMKAKRHTKEWTFIFYLFSCLLMSSVLWRCWLGDRKGIRPVKTESWGTGVVICLERGADLHTVQLMPLPLTVSCFSKIQIGFTFLVPAYPGSPGQRAVKWGCVCVCNKYYHHLYTKMSYFISYDDDDFFCLEDDHSGIDTL